MSTLADAVLQLKKIKNKKIRSFYEAQNEKLDDWLEVDLLVKSVSDDVIDSLDPNDVDGDGIPDPINGLHATGESIEPFLPDEEREARRKARRNARWAINVRCRMALYLGARLTSYLFR